jgi:hypothetical protein
MTSDVERNQASCGRQESDLLLLLYGDLDDAARRELEAHARTCASCASSLLSLKSVLDTVGSAHLKQRATVEFPGSWTSLRASLLLASPSRGHAWWKGAARAAAILLLAGASFAVGRLTHPWQPSQAPAERDAGARLDSAGRLALFSQRTNDYLDRSRMVLLELANGDVQPGRLSLSQASTTLLQENPEARRVAREVADRRLQELVAELETILGQIVQLHDAVQADRIRTYVNNSGVLEQLEILSAQPHRLAQERRRT